MAYTNLKNRLDTMCPVAKLAQLGTRIDALISIANAGGSGSTEAKTLTGDLKARMAEAKTLTTDLRARVVQADSLTDDLKARVAEAKTLTDELRRVALNHVTTAAGLAIGSGSKPKVLIANTVNYVIAGVMKTKTTAEVAFTATAHDITNDAVLVKEACYLLSLDAGGTCTITMGTISDGAGTAPVPSTPASNVPIGYVRIAVAAGATPFDASSDDLDAGHLTVAYVDVPCMFSTSATAMTAITAADMTALTATNMTAITAADMTAVTAESVEVLT